jgi:hypothetical protein
MNDGFQPIYDVFVTFFWSNNAFKVKKNKICNKKFKYT